MASIDAVIQALKEYTGTLIFVSHDLHFIRALGKRTIRIEAGRITNFAGDYDYYLWKSGSASAQTGLIEGLRDARPDQAGETESGGKALSAKENAGSAPWNGKKRKPYEANLKTGFGNWKRKSCNSKRTRHPATRNWPTRIPTTIRKRERN